ncbi:MAG: MqnA/MqnD/SBP family protein [Thermoguttaceae bacterium]
MNDSPLPIRVGHSPDPDDAFMFYALAQGKIATGRYHFTHELADIETLNRRAFSGDLELTALSVHAYAHLAQRYVLCGCGASMGDRYGPMVVARKTRPHPLPLSQRERGDWLGRATIAVPGRLTTACLALRLCLGQDFAHVLVPFDRILDAVQAGSYEGQPLDAGLVIHEGQLTYARQDLDLLMDLGQWWYAATGLPLPLGVNAVRRDLGPKVMADVQRLLLASIEYGLSHREEALGYALGFGRGLDRADADRFVGMYVNRWTLDLGPVGRQAVAELLARGHAAAAIPRLVVPEFVEE